MTSRAINSDEINSVSFPGAEDGLSLVQLIGTVEVSCSISFVQIRLTASAVVEPSAVVSSPTAKIKSLLGAVIDASAVPAGDTLVKRKSFAEATSARAVVAAATIYRERRLSAIRTATATTSASAVLKVPRSAAASSSATTSADSYKNAYLSGSTQPSAVVLAAGSRRVRSVSASTVPRAVVSANRTLIRRIGATTNAQALFSVSYWRKRPSTASTVALASIPNANFYFQLLCLQVQTEASAVPGQVAALSRIFFGADTLAQSTTEASIKMLLRVGATATATVSSAVAALDYSSTIPAPEERRMRLIEISRRMEVTT